MGLQNATILNGPTITPSGGTSTTLSTDGLAVTNGIHLIDASITDYRQRTSVTCKVKQPVQDNLGNWSKGRKSIQCAIPFVNTAGKTVFPLIRIELEDFPEMTVAQQDKLLSYGAQFCCDADFSSFFKTGSMA